MAQKRVTFYEILLYIAYGFFILLGASWFFMSLGGGFNATAFFIMTIFAVQAYYRHRITNLVLGILALFFSIFMLMETISSLNLADKTVPFDGFAKAMVAIPLVSLVMSVVLVFGYLKMSFKEQ